MIELFTQFSLCTIWVSAPLFAFATFKGRALSRSVAITWISFNVLVSLWAFFWWFGAFILQNASHRWFFMFLANWVAVGIPALFVSFALAFLNKLHLYKRSHQISWIASIALFAMAGLRPHLFVEDMQRIRLAYLPVAGPLLWVFALQYLVLVTWGGWILFQGFRTQTGVQRNRTLYVLVGCVIGFLGGLTTFPPALGIVKTYPYGVILIPVYSLMITYAIFKHHLLDIKLLTRDSLIFGIAAGGLTLPLIGLIATVSTPWIVLLLSLGWFLLALRWHPRLCNWLQPWIDRWVFGGQYNYLKDLKALGGPLYHIYSLPQLLETLVQRLAETLGITTCGIFLWESAPAEFRLAAAVGLATPTLGSKESPLRLAQVHPLVQTVAQYRGVLLREELVRRRPEAEFQAIDQAMTQLQAELVLPLYTEGELRGLLTLGPKWSGGMFHQRDLELLEQVVKDAERMVSYTVVLEQAMTIMKLAHDARQPVGAMGWQVEALRRDRLGPTTPEQQGTLQGLAANLQFLNEFFTDLMELHRVVTSRLESAQRLGPVDLGGLLRRVTESLGGKAAPGVAVRLELPPQLPLAFGQERGLQRVFNNLVVNALKFTHAGWVRVKVLPKQEWLEVQVQDTGPGVPPSEVSRIFDPFVQAAEGQKVTEGMGLGLAVVKEVVALHEGQVWVESRVGEGTTFIVRLPSVDSAFAYRHQPGTKHGGLRP